MWIVIVGCLAVVCGLGWRGAWARFVGVETAARAKEQELRLELKRAESRAEGMKRVAEAASGDELRAKEALKKAIDDGTAWRKAAERMDAELKLRLELRSRELAFLDRLESEGVSDGEVLSCFGMVDDSTPWWRAVNGFVAAQARIERGNAFAANLSTEARHFNAGRAAALEDLREQFVQLRVRGVEEAAKAA
jgi:hypothetical protein